MINLYLFFLMFFIVKPKIFIEYPEELSSLFNNNEDVSKNSNSEEFKFENHYKNGGIEMKTSFYGKIPNTLTGRIYYDIFNEDSYFCENIVSIPIEYYYLNTIKPILVVEKSPKCSYVTLSRNAQLRGAQALIIISNKSTFQDLKEIELVDDGTAKDIYIPTVLISKNDGDKIKNFYLKDRNIAYYALTRVLIEFKEIDSMDKLYFHAFYNPENYLIYEYLIELEDLIKNMGDFLVLDLIPFLSPYPKTLNMNDHMKDEQNKNCLNQGKYCIFPTNKHIDGISLIRESLTQYCIVTNYELSKYFIDYIKNYLIECLTPIYNNEEKVKDKTFMDVCSVMSMKKAGFKMNQIGTIKTCVFNTYLNGDDTNINVTLENFYMKKKEKYIKTLPTIMINNKIIHVRKIEVLE